MRPTMWNDAQGVQVVIDIPLPSAIHHGLRAQAQRFLERYRHHDGDGQLVVHVKRDGPQVACHAHLFSRRHTYHSYGAGWDARRVVDETLDAINGQQWRTHNRRIGLHA